MGELKKFRCSSFGRIMIGAVSIAAPTLTDTQEKELLKLGTSEKLTEKQQARHFELVAKKNTIATPQLSKGAKSYIEDEFMKDRFEFQTSFQNKYTEKGNICEQKSIEQVGKMLGYKFATKAKPKKLENSFIKTNGYDWKVRNFVFDQKNVWQPSGLKIFDEDKDLPIYEWQIRGYAMLLNELEDCKINKGAVIRVLMNPPTLIVQKEIKRMWVDLGNSLDSEISPHFVRNIENMFDFEGKFPDIKDRCRICIVDCADEHFEMIRTYVALAQAYYQSLEAIAESANLTQIETLKNR